MRFSPGHWWWRFRRESKRGWRAVWGDYILGPRIWRWRNPHFALPAEHVPVVLVLGRDHLTMAAWMLASWTIATGRNWRIYFHDDGTLPNETREQFARLRLSVTVISRNEANTEMAARLSALPRCRSYREGVPLGLKIFDVPEIQSAPRLLLIDPDVLFFRRPDEILTWCDRPQDFSCWFNVDVAEASNVPAAEAHARLGLELWPRVNSGLCLLTRSAIDLDFCEKVLEQTSIREGHFWRVEQTLFAICASRYEKGGLLPETYEVSLDAFRRSAAIARHYVGAVRHRFWAEGVWTLNSELRIG